MLLRVTSYLKILLKCIPGFDKCYIHNDSYNNLHYPIPTSTSRISVGSSVGVRVRTSFGTLVCIFVGLSVGLTHPAAVDVVTVGNAKLPEFSPLNKRVK